MYLEHFGLLEAPFSIAPDPRYLYMSERHREALAHLLYGLESDGAFILLTGDVGTGKTTVSRCLLEQVPLYTNLALVLNPKLSALELLQVICDELQIEYDTQRLSIKNLIDGINAYLLEQHALGRNTVLLIEEAQNLDLDVLEQLRLLTNLETSERKLLQVILLGQPEFLDVLSRPDLSQLAQRITARFHLSPLNFNEVQEYVTHRLAVAGCRRPLFSYPRLKQVYQYSGGVPRLINVICDRALLGAYVQEHHQPDKATLKQAASEVLGAPRGAKSAEAKIASSSRRFGWLARPGWIAAWLVMIGLAAALYFSQYPLAGFSVSEYLSGESSLDDVELSAGVQPESDLPPQLPVDEAAVETPLAAIQWADDSLRLRSNLLSYQALFERWNIPYQLGSDGTPCFHAQTRGLACLQDTGDIDSLRQLNRPAVIKLYDDFNQPQYATLLGLADSQQDEIPWAVLFLANRQQIISLEQLAYYWKGEYSLFWKKPSEYQQLIRPGDEGEAVVWLHQQINQIENNPQGVVSSYYDARLEQKVKAFQLNQGLQDDGMVGVKTLIHMNHILQPGLPVLNMPLPELESNS
ncbi:MAG TPA: AAA family ATPase [Gammaproteobacteria bacterium]